MKKDTKHKKEQFAKQEKKSVTKFLGIGVAMLLLVVAGFVIFNPGEQEIVYFGEPVAEARSYVGEFISMTEVEPEITEDELRLSLSEVDKYNIVSFEVENDEGTLVPFMAYITPSGRLFVGSSMCEPCRGRTFSLAGETLFCDVCRTTYTIEEHEFISGATACGSYPPVNMNPVVEGDVIIIDMQNIREWRIRA